MLLDLSEGRYEIEIEQNLWNKMVSRPENKILDKSVNESEREQE
jgi:hypothetical protein